MGEILSAGSIEGVVRKDVPERVISRLPIYLQTVETIAATGQTTVSSEALASRSGVSPSILRKDLSQLGRPGRRGVGYACAELAATLRSFLGLDRAQSVAIIGAGRLGSALADYAGFRGRGLRLTAIFDVDEAKIGTTIGALTVSDLSELATWPDDIDLVVMAVPASPAPAAARIAAHAGVRGILNFAPTLLQTPDSVRVRQVDLAS
ncbi:redox-sensing transcriptional repressor Rex, partial [Burkholderia multivorans]|uniref:redox-sensing transcriptional repressor Rex n=1 Tax=Burkholderia multivorans TaxID=87883 RepID=UPI000DAE0297